jgi:hypothetical protein
MRAVLGRRRWHRSGREVHENVEYRGTIQLVQPLLALHSYSWGLPFRIRSQPLRSHLRTCGEHKSRLQYKLAQDEPCAVELPADVLSVVQYSSHLDRRYSIYENPLYDVW